MFYFPECVLYVIRRVMTKVTGFPHSDISGSKIARHLPEAFRRHAASFITSLESRHPPYALKFPIRKFINHNWVLIVRLSSDLLCPAKWNQLPFSMRSKLLLERLFPAHLHALKDPKIFFAEAKNILIHFLEWIMEMHVVELKCKSSTQFFSTSFSFCENKFSHLPSAWNKSTPLKMKTSALSSGGHWDQSNLWRLLIPP